MRDDDKMPTHLMWKIIFLVLICLFVLFYGKAKAAYGPLVCHSQIKNSHLVVGDKFDIVVQGCFRVIENIYECSLTLGHFVVVISPSNLQTKRTMYFRDFEYVGIQEGTEARIFKQ
jgi:hypothetical protein